MVVEMREKITIESARELFKSNGCELLENEYKTAKTVMKYRCVCGNESTIRYDDFRRGKRCLQCKYKKQSEESRTPFAEVKSMFEKEGYTVVSDKVDKNRKVDVICPKGHSWKATTYTFKSGARCMKCQKEKLSEKYRKPLEEVKAIFESEGAELLSEYVNTETPVTYRCVCGNTAVGYIKAFEKGVRCGCNVPKGKDHRLYNPNISDEEREDKRKKPEVNEWRLDVFKRDDFTCQKCFVRGTKIEAHHIENWASNKKLRYTVSNGITLCKDCHRTGNESFHKIYGLKNNTLKQLEDFLGRKISTWADSL